MSPALQMFLFVFSNGEYVNLTSSVICLWLEGNISSPVKYSYSIFPNYNADIFADNASLLIFYYND